MRPTFLPLLAICAVGCLSSLADLTPLPDDGVDSGINDGGAWCLNGPADNADWLDGGFCTPGVAATTGCFCLGQTCRPELGVLGGCVSPLDCYPVSDGQFGGSYVCCKHVTGVPICE